MLSGLEEGGPARHSLTRTIIIRKPDFAISHAQQLTHQAGQAARLNLPLDVTFIDNWPSEVYLIADQDAAPFGLNYGFDAGGLSLSDFASLSDSGVRNLVIDISATLADGVYLLPIHAQSKAEQRTSYIALQVGQDTSQSQVVTLSLSTGNGPWYANGLDDIPVTVQALNSVGDGTAFAGRVITLTGATLGTLLSDTLTLNGQGVASTTYRAGLVAGVDSLTAQVRDGGRLLTDTASLTLNENDLQADFYSHFDHRSITYTLVVSNAGLIVQERVVLTGSIPTNTALITVTGGTAQPLNRLAQVGYVVLPPQTLAPGEQYTMTWQVAILNPYADIEVEAAVSSDTSRLLLNVQDRLYRIILLIVFK